MESSIDLGFIEKCEPWLLTNKFFPSKLGGRPAWLDLEQIPQTSEIKCAECDSELIFLCQVYAPLDEYDHCFHRIIYMFICTDPACWHPNVASNIKAFRCQLPRSNAFYDYEPSSEDEKSDEVPSPIRLCLVCGCRGPLSCGKCRSAHYCGAAHQRVDWTLGEHKKLCGTDGFDSSKLIGNPKHGVLFEEFELITEPEEQDTSAAGESEEQAEQRRLKDYEKFLAEQKAKTTDDELKNVPDEEFNKYTSQVDEDVLFGKFKKRIALDEEQVLRFDRKGNPLWITDKHCLDANLVPNCERCGSRRVFEFQIMPQLLNHLNTPEIDWGIIAVFTCEQSCDTNGEYTAEFVYKQDIVHDAPQN